MAQPPAWPPFRSRTSGGGRWRPRGRGAGTPTGRARQTPVGCLGATAAAVGARSATPFSRVSHWKTGAGRRGSPVGPTRRVEDGPFIEECGGRPVFRARLNLRVQISNPTPDRKGLLLRSCRAPARNLNLVGAARLKSEFWARCAPISSVAARTSAGARVKNEWSPATPPRTEKRTATAVRRAIHQPPPPLTAPSDRGLSPACDVIPFPLSPARAAACASGARPASTHPSRLHTSR